MTGRVSTPFLVLFGLFFVAACSNAKHYQMKGQVLAIDRDKVEILVNHEDIPGLMPAMTMPYKVESVTMLDNLGPGDLISTDLAVENGTAVITKITKTGTAGPEMVMLVVVCCRSMPSNTRMASSANAARRSSGSKRIGRWA